MTLCGCPGPRHPDVLHLTNPACCVLSGHGANVERTAVPECQVQGLVPPRQTGHGTTLPLQTFVFVLLREVLTIVSSMWTQRAEFSTLASVVLNGYLNAQFTCIF